MSFALFYFLQYMVALLSSHLPFGLCGMAVRVQSTLKPLRQEPYALSMLQSFAARGDAAGACLDRHTWRPLARASALHRVSLESTRHSGLQRRGLLFSCQGPPVCFTFLYYCPSRTGRERVLSTQGHRLKHTYKQSVNCSKFRPLITTIAFMLSNDFPPRRRSTKEDGESISSAR